MGCMNPQEQHTLGSHVNQTPENQTGSSGRWIWALREPPPLIWLVVAKCSGATWVTGINSACHRQLKWCPQTSRWDTFSEQNWDRKLWMENRADWGSRISKRREDRQMQPFNVVISLLHYQHHLWVLFFCSSLSVCRSCLWLSARSLLVSARYNHRPFHNRDIQNAPWVTKI